MYTEGRGAKREKRNDGDKRDGDTRIGKRGMGNEGLVKKGKRHGKRLRLSQSRNRNNSKQRCSAEPGRKVVGESLWLVACLHIQVVPQSPPAVLC